MSQMVCITCRDIGRSTDFTRGSLLTEIILWICFVVPGFIYSLWRVSTSAKIGCPSCKTPSMVPVRTHVGKIILNKHNCCEQEEETITQYAKQKKIESVIIGVTISCTAVLNWYILF